MKKSITVALLTIFILQAGGMLLVYKIQQWYVQEEVQESLNSENILCQNMTLSHEEYQTSKINSSEIFYKGKMYDVRSVKVLDSVVVLSLYHDSEEENILEKIGEYIKRTVDNKDFPNHLYQFLSMNYIFTESEYVFFIFTKDVTFFNSENPNTIPGNFKISIPPPRRA